MADLIVELDEVKTESGEWATGPSATGSLADRANSGHPEDGDVCGPSPRWGRYWKTIPLGHV